MKPSPQQFEQLAIEQLDALYRLARRLTGDLARADDLVQDTYARALRARDRFDLQAHGIRPWMMRIMHNAHISRGERENRQPAFVEDVELENAGANHTAEVWNLNSFQSMDEQIVRAINGLVPEYQIVLLLWAVDELSYKEIAEVLEVPIGTVMSRLYRARLRLSEQLREYALREGIIRE